MRRPIRVLHLEDRPRDAEVIRHLLDVESLACDIFVADTRDSFESALTREAFDLILCDYNIPDYDGMTALRHAQATSPDVPIILISGTVGDEQAVACLHVGATDYLLKDRLERLVPAVKRALHEAETRLARRRAEVELRESQERYRYIVETTNDGVWLIDAERKTTFMNRRMAQILGCETDMGLGRSPSEFLDDTGQASLAAYLDAGQAYQAEVRYIRSDGTSVWTLVDATPKFDDGGRFTGWLATVKDISDRRRAADEFRELSRRTEQRERILTTMLSFISDFAYVYDRDGRFLFVNQPLLDLWGLRLEDAVGKNFFDLGYPADLAALLLQQVADVFETKAPVTGETPYTSPAGVSGYYEYIFSPAFGADGAVEFVVGSTRDITERRQAQDSLRTSLEEFRSLAEAMPQIVWITTPDGANIYFNQQWMDYTGLTLEESLGDRWSTPFHPDDRPHAWDAWSRATASGDTYVVESRIRRFDGVYRWWLIRGVPVPDSTGRILKWFGTCTDIHDLKVADLEVMRTNRALQMLSSCNEALIRADLELALLKNICRIAVDLGGYRMAWVGYAQNDEVQSITPIAHHGREAGFLAERTLTWSDHGPDAQDPTGQAIRTGQVILCEDVAAETIMAPWSVAARERGYGGVIVLPLREGAHTFGALALYCADRCQPSADELELLKQLADDLAFGIAGLRARSDRQRLGNQVRDQAALLDIAHDAIYVRDLSGYIIYWNKGAERVYGWSAEEALGRRAVELLCDDCTDFGAAESALFVTGDWQGEAIRRTKSKGDVIVAVRWTVVLDAKGQPRSILAINTDITEQKRAIDTVRAAEERMRFVVEAAGVGIWDLDFTTGVLEWSEGLEAQFGMAPGTFGGTFAAFVARIHPEDREALLKTMNAHHSGAKFSIEHRTLWSNGTIRWLSGAGRIDLGPDGAPVRGVGISLDVTERHSLETQYQQAQKMEAIGRLAGGVAHDFNNLLTVILGFCELLLTDLTPDDPRQKDIAEIQKAGARAAGLTRQLLAFSRKELIAPAPLDINLVVDDIRVMLGRLIGEDIRIVLDLAPSLTLILADRGQIEQIIMNLVVNARDAMPTGGTLTIETDNVVLADDAHTHLPLAPGAYVVLTVTDTGTGMTPEVQARLFEPFFTTKEAGKGTGLGMATVHGIAARSGGTVTVDSEVGRGTTFKVFFPRSEIDEPVALTPSIVDRKRVGGETVLVVEDADGLRALSKRLLERQGYTVLLAANADEARHQFDRNASIDVLLTDVVMPDVSGPELVKSLGDTRPMMKVIYMSGYTDDAIAHHGILDPSIAFLHKPFSSETLGRKIRDALDN